MMWRVAAVAESDVSLQFLPRRAKENNEKPQAG
jgi:hypothetical protein